MRQIKVIRSKVKSKWVDINGEKVYLPVKTTTEEMVTPVNRFDTKYENGTVKISQHERTPNEYSENITLSRHIEREVERCDRWEKDLLKKIESIKKEFKKIQTIIEGNQQDRKNLLSGNYELIVKKLPDVVEENE